MKLTIGTHEMGFVVVTNDAILSVQSKSANEAGGAAVGGVVGRKIAETLEKRKATREAVQPAPPIAALSDVKGVHVCTIGDLPATVVSSPGWPRVEKFRPVTIYPRPAIQAAKASIWRGLVLEIAGQSLPMAVQMWQVGKLKRHLVEAGYRLK